MSYLLGIDVGTTNTKALVYDPARQVVVAVGHVPTKTVNPRPDWAEFPPEALWQGVAQAIRQALAAVDRPDAVTGVAVSSMGEAGVPIDRRGRCLYPAIAWYDPRTEPQRAWWEQNLDAFAVYEVTGHPVRVIYSVHKLAWLRDNEPAVYQAMDHWLCIEDFVLWKLSGEIATDYTIASRTSLFDQRTHQWSRWVADQVGLDLRVMPTAHPSGTVIGRVSARAANETGLPPGTPVITGGHDHLCGALASGVVMPGAALDSTGTAEALLVTTRTYHPDRRLFEGGYSCYSHVVKDAYVAIGGLTAAGRTVEWLLDLLWPEMAGSGRASLYAQAFAEAAASPAGARGLAWSPITHSGSPTNDPKSRGAVLGITTAHTRGDFLRALIESMGFWLRENVEYVESVFGAGATERIVSIGGATNSPWWMQIKADATGRDIFAAKVGDSAPLGAAMLAGLGVGVWKDARELAQSVSVASEVYRPGPAAPQYDSLYRTIYTQLYPTLRAMTHRLSD